MRCDDAWYNAFLNACRHGKMDLDTYAFFHGWPTDQPARCAACTCSNRSWVESFVHGARDGSELIRAECEACKEEREKRARGRMRTYPDPSYHVGTRSKMHCTKHHRIAWKIVLI
jgi:hypothetical protein